jgi:hypothetical protein
VLAAAGVFLLWATRGLTFLMDEWNFVQSRLDWNADAFLVPHNQHLLALDILLYKLLFVTVGLRDFLPYRLMAITVHLLAVALLFEFARRRIGPVLAAALAIPLLVFGSGWFVLLFPFNVQWTISLAALIAVIMLLERPSRRRDVLAGVLLLISLAASSLGVAAAVGVLVALLVRPDRWRRVWVALVPLALYGVWFLDYGVDAPKAPGSEWTIAPMYLFHLAAGAVGGLLGLALRQPAVADRPFLSHAVHVLTLGLALALAVELIRRRARLTTAQIVLVTTTAVYWITLMVSRAYQHEPYSTQYVYVGAALVALLVAAFLPAPPTRPVLLGAVVAVAAISTALNVAVLLNNAKQRRWEANMATAEVTAIEIARKTVHPMYHPDEDPARATQVSAGTYLHAVDRLGSTPAVSQAKLLELPEVARSQADAVLVAGLHVRALPLTAALRRLLAGEGSQVAQVCQRVRPGPTGGGTRTMTLSPGGAVVTPLGRDAVELRVRRFGAAYPALPAAVVRTKSLFAAPLGEATRPWRLRASSRGAFEIC